MENILEVKINGLDKLQNQLESMKFNVARKILKQTLQRVGDDFALELFQSAPRSNELRNSPGWLASHIGAQVKMHAGDIAGSVYVGGRNVDYPRHGSRVRRHKHYTEVGSTIDVPSILRFLEYGTQGNVEKNPFMTRTWDGFKNTALDQIIEDIRDTIEASVK